MTKDKPKDAIVTSLVIIPRQNLENTVFYDNKQLDNLNFYGLKYETEYTHSNIRAVIVNEFQINKHELVSLNNKRIKLRKK